MANGTIFIVAFCACISLLSIAGLTVGLLFGTHTGEPAVTEGPVLVPLPPTPPGDVVIIDPIPPLVPDDGVVVDPIPPLVDVEIVGAPPEVDMQIMELAILERADQLGSVDCLDFMANRDAHAGKHILMHQACFDSGTFRATHPGHYKYIGDVVFDPNADQDSRITPEQRASGEYPTSSGYALGFFTAFEVASHNVMHDLNKHQLSQSRNHNMKMPFFSLIEIASSCFVPGEGPTDFGQTFFSPRNTSVCNGHLSDSVHHGIHSNGATDFYIHDLEMRNYQVAAIAMNGASYGVIARVRALGTDQRIPLKGSFSQTRFLLPVLDQHIADEPALQQTTERLRALHDQALADVLERNFVDERVHGEAYRLFANADELADGGFAGGFIITNRGAAVVAFDAEFVEEGCSHNIAIVQCEIRETVTAAKEVVAYYETPIGPDGPKVVRGPFGDVVDFQRVMEAGSIDADALTQAHFQYGLAVRRAAARGVELTRGGTLFIPDALLDWYEQSTDGGRVDDPLFAAAVRQANLAVARNGDPMFHVSKGAVGLRIDGSRDILVTETTISGVIAAGAAAQTALLPGEDPLAPWRRQCSSTGECYTNVDGGHPDQGHMVGYGGNFARGILVGGARNIVIEPSVTVEGVVSYTGVAIEFDNGEEQNSVLRRTSKVRSPLAESLLHKRFAKK